MATLTPPADPQPAGGSGGPNWALIMTIALPAIAVIASFTSLGLVLMAPDPEMPQEYHWEGARLDQDFARAERAAAIDVRARLSVTPAEHLCRVSFASEAPPPDALVLRLVHATRSAFDRTLTLRPAFDGYEASCEPPAKGHWLVELTDPAATWSVRTESLGVLQSLELRARSPSGRAHPGGTVTPVIEPAATIQPAAAAR